MHSPFPRVYSHVRPIIRVATLFSKLRSKLREIRFKLKSSRTFIKRLPSWASDRERKFVSINQSPPPSSPFISRVNPGEPAGLSIDTTCDNWQSIGAVAAEIIARARARLPLPSLDPSKSTFSVSLEYIDIDVADQSFTYVTWRSTELRRRLGLIE